MTFRSLPVKNLLGNKSRSTLLFIFSVLLSFSLFSGFTIIQSLKNGLKSLEYRLGADIMVVPKTAYEQNGLEEILLKGNRTCFYLENTKIEDISAIDGVEKLSPQTFLATLDAGCCSVGLEIIGFNPNTDFTVRPWLSQTYKGTLHEGEIIVGSKINALKGDSMTFFNTKCTVAARLKETGTGLDNAVYATAATIKKLLESPAAAGRTMPQGAVSTILIKAKEGSDLDSIVRSINWSSKDIKAVKTKTLTASIAKSLSSISTVTSAMIAAVCLLCLLLMAIVFSLVSSERKKAFAILRVLGASKRKLTALVLSEAFIITAAGGLFGGTAGAILLLSFKAFIENFVSMPFLLPEPGILAANAIAVVVAAIAAGSLTAAATAYSISKTDTGIILKNGN